MADSAGEQWPPKDPEAYVYPDEDPNHKLELPASPWTYKNGTINSELQATTTRRRKSAQVKAAASGPYSFVPPYHPDYHRQESSDAYPVDSQSEEDDEDDEDRYNQVGRPREFVRRGSEGYEVRPIDREDLLRQYVEDRTAEPGRYNLYVPEPYSEPESGTDDEQIPLAEKLERWHTTKS